MNNAKKIIFLGGLMLCFFALPARAEGTPTSTDYITASITVRYQDQILFNGAVTVPSSTLFSYNDTDETKTTSTSYTALAALLNADTASDNFAVNEITYYPGMGFLIKCLNLADATSACNNWRYTVNSTYPDAGADAYILSGGEQIYFYYGDRQRVSVPTTSYYIGETATGTIMEYDYQNNAYTPLANTVLGLLDTTDYALTTATSDASGETVFALNATGTFRIGMQNWGGAYYWPKSPDFNVADIPATVTSTSSTESDGTGGGNNGGGGGISYQKINVSQALNFLTSQQTEGNFGSNLLTDWSAIAFAADGTNSTKEKIKKYLIANTDSSGGLNSVSNDARRALALMSLGVNPYTDTTINYIKKITDTFDGTQFGDNTLYNDDIFALLVLLKSGYTVSDPMVMTDINFILSKQSNDGSFGGIDLTAAAVQALELTGDANAGVAITKAKNYLKTNQNSDGSFAGPTPSISTAWGVQALLDSSDNVARGNNYLYTKQTDDGGLENDADMSTRVWATAYAIPVALQKSWGMIIQNFNKPQLTDNVSNGGNTVSLSTTTLTPTSTPILATTTPEINTSTLALATTTIENATTTVEISTTTKTNSTTVYIRTETLTLSPRPSPPLDGRVGGSPKNKSEKDSSTTLVANAPRFAQNDIVNDSNNLTIKQLNNLPLDTPTRQTAKKILKISGGSTIALGVYLGLKLLRGVI